ncbi:hypothetical protein [Chamaesiphon sp. GL140_3_metabinner_50]|uniref:hypothetical protein n=1 Tax=Chamaesiphon sp. GL140_3_metabinner_50 TaxID=2970812 RepID=UPI0025FA897E|nr:hypothetical protein [Chamaesiphon sp. GL140_3_metabinner_50]
MKRKQEKPIYGNSQGAKASEIDLNLGDRKKSKLTAQKSCQSGELFDKRTGKLRQRSRHPRFARIKPVAIKSFPRTILKVGIVALVIHQGLTHTQIGKSLMAKISQQMVRFNTHVETTKTKVNIKALTENRQKNADDRFDDAWNRAGGEPKKKE